MLLSIATALLVTAGTLISNDTKPESIDTLGPTLWSLVRPNPASPLPTPIQERVTDQYRSVQISRAPRNFTSVPLDIVREIVCSKEFTWPCNWAIALVFCESSNGAGKIGYELYDSNSDGILEQWYFYGWFQIASRVPPGGAMDWLLQPYLNTVEGHYKYHTEGVGAWPNCP